VRLWLVLQGRKRCTRRILVPIVICAFAAGVLGLEGQPAVTPHITFVDVAERAGLRFVHEYSPTPEKHIIESVPGGLAAFDYDGDGRTDVFFTNGATSPGLEKRDRSHWNRLFRNEAGRFVDVTESAGVKGIGYAMGAAAADYDNDGDVDLFVAGVRRNQLLRNTGKGAFEDVTTSAGIGSGEWSVAAGWFDYDNDRWLDLFVVTYLNWTPAFDRFCGDEGRKIRVYCHPRYFEGLGNKLYRNRADGTFEDVSARAGISQHVGKGMSVAFLDADSDGRLDVFVTNDGVPNFLFRNRGDGTFEELGLLAGVALPSHGRALASMGVDAADYDNDGTTDIHVTALDGETFPLFRADGRGAFIEATHASGLALLTRQRSAWCTAWMDVDNDGWKDLFTANSHVNDRIDAFAATTWKQANSVFVNTGNGRFREVTDVEGLGSHVAAHRGCAVADFNVDGRLDVVVSALGQPAELWENRTEPAGHWLVVKLVGTASNRPGIGARVTVAGQTRTMTTSTGYASSSHAGLHFGLGGRASVDKLEIHWPSGAKQVLADVAADRVIEVEEPNRGPPNRDGR
jgi:enediyne biosynthesis protein E4